MKIALVVPVYNEEKYLPLFLKSIQLQNRAPDQIVLVNDGSTDGSLKLLQTFAKAQERCKIAHTKAVPKHSPGAKVVRAFNAGYTLLDPEADIICKFDADIELPYDYLEKLEEAFKDPRVGMVSGSLYIQKNNDWVREEIAKERHIRGPIKAYSKKCFAAIGGLRETLGWDTIDVALTELNNFKTLVLPNLKVKHYKPTATSYTKKQGRKMGEAMRAMGYDPLLTLIALAKAAWIKRSARVLLQGFVAYWTHKNTALKKQEKIQIRNWRWKSVLKQFTKRAE